MILCKEILQPGVPGQTAQNIHASNQLAIVAGALLALSIALAIGQYLAHRKLSATALSLVCIIITMFHPVWTVSTRSGDCGVMRHFFSWVVA